MKKIALLAAVLLAVPAAAEKKYKLVPDSPEERMILEINGESDAKKRIAMLDDFRQKFAASEALPYTYHMYLNAYLELQDLDKAVEYADKAVDADNENLTVLVTAARAVQAKADFARAHRFSAMAMSLQKTALAKRPDDMDDDDWKKRQETLKSYAQFLEYALWDAVSRDKSPERIKYIESYAQLFPDTENAKKLLAMQALHYQQMNDVARMMEYAEKAIAADPESETMLLLLGETHVQLRKRLADAQTLAQRLLKVMEGKKKPAGANDADWEKYINAYSGAAHSIIGRALMIQEKTAPAITELQTAAKLLEGNNEALGPVLYFWGWGLAKLARYNDARPVLSRAASLGGPYAQPAGEILQKIRKATGK